MTDVSPVELYSLGDVGIITDIRGHLIPPEAWTSGKNILFTKNGVQRALGYSSVLGTLSVVPEFIFNAPGSGASFWIYCSLTKAYVYESGVHTNITRQSAGVDVDYTTVNGRDWQGTMFGGIPILNNGIDIPQYWTSLNITSNLANLTNWPTDLRANLIKSFGPYLIALNLLDNGTRLASGVQWSDKADPGTLPSSWDYTDPTVDAGRMQLTDSEGGDIKDGLLLGNQLIVYKEYSTHTLRYVGGQDILGADLLLSDSGILTAKCVCAYKHGTRHFVVTANDIITHGGTKVVEHIADDRVKAEIFSNIDPTNFEKSFVFENPSLNQCLFVYPTLGSTYPNLAAVWDYNRNTWSFRDWDGVSVDVGNLTESTETAWDAESSVWDDLGIAWSRQERLQVIVVSSENNAAWQFNSGYAFGNLAIVSYVERTELAIDGVDRFKKPTASLSSIKQLSRVWPKVTGEANLSIYVGSQDIINGAIIYKSGQTFNPLTQKYIDEIVTAPLLCIRFEANDDEAWTLQGYDLEISRVARL